MPTYHFYVRCPVWVDSLRDGDFLDATHRRCLQTVHFSIMRSEYETVIIPELADWMITGSSCQHSFMLIEAFWPDNLIDYTGHEDRARGLHGQLFDMLTRERERRGLASITDNRPRNILPPLRGRSPLRDAIEMSQVIGVATHNANIGQMVEVRVNSTGRDQAFHADGMIQVGDVVVQTPNGGVRLATRDGMQFLDNVIPKPEKRIVKSELDVFIETITELVSTRANLFHDQYCTEDLCNPRCPKNFADWVVRTFKNTRPL